MEFNRRKVIKNDEDYLISRTYTNYGGGNMAFDLSDEELQATREMNKMAWESDIDKWSKEYLIERYKDLVEIEKVHKKENGELRERIKEFEEKAYKKEYYEEVAEELYKNSIPKSKVRDKINKLGTYREKHFYFRKDLSKAQHDKSMKMLGGIKYLQELLEERN